MCVFAGSDWVRHREGKLGNNNFPEFASVIGIKSSRIICQIYSTKSQMTPLLFGPTYFKDNILWSHFFQASLSVTITSHVSLAYAWLHQGASPRPTDSCRWHSVSSVHSPASGWVDKSETNPSSVKREKKYTLIVPIHTSPQQLSFQNLNNIEVNHLFLTPWCDYLKRSERNPLWVRAVLDSVVL